jgi:pyrroline-5-carboxylate reductase
MKVGFIGGGNMAEAIIASLLSSKTLEAHEIFASDIAAERRDALKKRYGINVYSRNDTVVAAAEILFLAVKPQNLGDVLAGVAADVTEEHLVVSIAAGKRIAFVQSYLSLAKVVRVMPNMATLVAEGMSVFCAGEGVTQAQRGMVRELLSCSGKVLELPEASFDAVTALSGSGPAFFAYLLARMVDGAVAEGLERADALLLAEQTMLGTSRLLIERGVDPEDLIGSVASAKGTTAAGLDVLDGSQVGGELARTIAAAARRSRELSA